ncbi:alpha/beta fold hydrolase [Acaryochloris marina NIES-2412]|uniref:alpha/beta fold hydrolase n=1 Tax=Acaryochloris marina TaxID=155978 RepID=UPI00405A3B41
MKIKNTDGTETVYSALGNAANEAIVLLHGIGADHMMWQPQMEEFANNGFYVLTLDLLGHGQSSKVKHLELRDWENQIFDLLREHQRETCILVGVSMGGVIAQSFAVNHPDRVSRLIVSDTFAELKTPLERALGLSQVIGFWIFKRMGAAAMAKGLASTYKAPFARQAKDYFSQVALEADFDQLILARRAINRIDVVEQLRHLKIPTLVMVGDQFGQLFVEINRKIANAVMDAKFVILNEAMDPSNLVNSSNFNRETLTFLQAKSKPG